MILLYALDTRRSFVRLVINAPSLMRNEWIAFFHNNDCCDDRIYCKGYAIIFGTFGDGYHGKNPV